MTAARDTTPADGRRNDILRQAGLTALCARASAPAWPIALVDGAVDVAHPVFDGCDVTTIGERHAGAAGMHATFSASILVASEADRMAGRALGIAAGAAVLNIAAVNDRTLTVMPIAEVARVLCAAVQEAARRGCRVMVFGVEIRRPESREWAPLRESLRAAARAGAVVILPAGNRDALIPTPVCWPEVLVATSHGRRGTRSLFSPASARCGNTIVAPGEEIPGAGDGARYVVRSGTSFAAAVAGGAIARAAADAPDRDIVEIAAALCAPPARVLNAARLAAVRPSCSEREELHAIADA